VCALRRIFPVLGRVAAIAQAPERTLVNRFELRRRAFLALGELFGRIADRRPLVVAMEDLQWTDADSTALLLHLLRQREVSRVLIVGGHSGTAAANPALSDLYQTLERDSRIDARRIALGARPIGPAEQPHRRLRDRPV
jgi:predicted ATPase